MQVRSLSLVQGITLALALTLLPTLRAQGVTSPQARSIPAIEDRELYYAFFNYHQGLINAAQAAKNANPQTSSQIDQQMANLLQVDVKELPSVNGNTQQVTQSYAGLPALRAAWAATPAKPNQPAPNATQLDGAIELKRTRITIAGVTYLFMNLTQASWTGLHGYIVGAYKSAIYQH